MVPDRSNVTVAVVQAEVPHTLADALERCATHVRTARGRSADLVAFPETWIPGYPAWLDVCRDAGLWDHAPVKRLFASMAENSISVPGTAVDELARIARENSVVLIIGAIERIASGPGRGTLYNVMLTFNSDGELLNHHRKLMPTFTERMVWGPGDAAGLRAVDTKAGRVGGLICWEHWMPLARQALHDSGEDIHVAMWPTAHEMNQIACRQYAFEGRCFVLVAGSLMRAGALPPELERDPQRAPGDDALVLRGGSAIIGPDGRYLVEPVFDVEEVVVADLDLRRVREEQMSLDVSGHYSRRDVFTLNVDRQRPG